jgi:heterodisulfide reductase subunit B
MTTSYLYYPGCSMDSSAKAYASSLEAVCGSLGIDLHEVDDWNCCGATEYLSISQTRAHALVARNLALAEQQRNGTSTLVAPCSACFVNLARTEHYMRDDRGLAATVNAALDADGMRYTPGSIAVRHLFEVLVDEIGIEAIGAQVVRPLSGLRVAPYLGCLVTRPDYDGRWRNREHPLAFDRMLAALGAEVVDFPGRTDCCGGHLTQISPGMGFELIRRLVDSADRLGADMLVTICPMCQMNVDAYQGEMNRYFHTHHHMPILFFTQLMALAFGAPPEKVGLGSELVSAAKALGRIGIEVPVVEADEAVDAGAGGRTRRQKRPTGLPMPPAPDDGEVRS